MSQQPPALPAPTPVIIIILIDGAAAAGGGFGDKDDVGMIRLVRQVVVDDAGAEDDAKHVEEDGVNISIVVEDVDVEVDPMTLLLFLVQLLAPTNIISTKLSLLLLRKRGVTICTPRMR